MFVIAVQALQPFVGVELSSLSRQDVVALVRFLSLAEQILSWDFTPHHHILHNVAAVLSLTELYHTLGPEVLFLRERRKSHEVAISEKREKTCGSG